MQLLGLRSPRLRHAFAIPAALVLALLYLSLLLDFSRASDAASIAQEDHNHYRILELQSKVYGPSDLDHKLEMGQYKAEFL